MNPVSVNLAFRLPGEYGFWHDRLREFSASMPAC